MTVTVGRDRCRVALQSILNRYLVEHVLTPVAHRVGGFSYRRPLCRPYGLALANVRLARMGYRVPREEEMRGSRIFSLCALRRPLYAACCIGLLEPD
jgi:hypothetical protein